MCYALVLAQSLHEEADGPTCCNDRFKSSLWHACWECEGVRRPAPLAVCQAFVTRTRCTNAYCCCYSLTAVRLNSWRLHALRVISISLCSQSDTAFGRLRPTYSCSDSQLDKHECKWHVRPQSSLLLVSSACCCEAALATLVSPRPDRCAQRPAASLEMTCPVVRRARMPPTQRKIFVEF